MRSGVLVWRSVRTLIAVAAGPCVGSDSHIVPMHGPEDVLKIQSCVNNFAVSILLAALRQSVSRKCGSVLPESQTYLGVRRPSWEMSPTG